MLATVFHSEETYPILMTGIAIGVRVTLSRGEKQTVMVPKILALHINLDEGVEAAKVIAKARIGAIIKTEEHRRQLQ